MSYLKAYGECIKKSYEEYGFLTTLIAFSNPIMFFAGYYYYKTLKEEWKNDL